MIKDLVIDSKIWIHTDSSTCRDICGRTDIVKNRHMMISLLRLQGVVREKKIEMTRITGKDKIANLLTKFVGPEDLDRRCRSFDFTTIAESIIR